MRAFAFLAVTIYNGTCYDTTGFCSVLGMRWSHFVCFVSTDLGIQSYSLPGSAQIHIMCLVDITVDCMGILTFDFNMPYCVAGAMAHID